MTDTCKTPTKHTNQFLIQSKCKLSELLKMWAVENFKIPRDYDVL